MRRGISIILMFVLCSISYGQTQMGEMKHFIELHQFITGSGFAPSTELCFKLNRDNKKAIAFGVFYCNEFTITSGISFHYEIMIFREEVILKNLIKPYVFYNLIYRKTSITKTIEDKITKNNLGLYTSMEHHVGIGSKINLSKSLYASCNLGFGPYLGSIKKPTNPNQYTDEIIGTNGFGIFAGVGIGCYIF
jgi:hypothetical protein